jgi:hypothetical protein
MAADFPGILSFDRHEAGKGAEKRLRFMDKPVNFKRLPRGQTKYASKPGAGEATLREGRI